MRINIVTINLNNKVGLERTINSVLSQTFFDKIDYIIIDGGSTDGSKELIEEHKDKLFYWASEPDNGIFNAMNKAVDRLVGDYVLFLNSGDFLHSSDVIEKVYERLDKDIVFGNEVFFFNNGSYFLSTYQSVLDEAFFMRSALPHQSTFIRVPLMKAHKYNESCTIAGDWTFFREAIMKYGATYKYLPDMTISNYGCNGISSTHFHIFVEEKQKYYRQLNMMNK